MEPVSNKGMLVSSFDISDRTGLLSYKWSCGSVTEAPKLNADIEETEIRTVLHALHATKMEQDLEKLWIKLVSEIPQDMFQSMILQTRLAGRGLHQALPVVHTLTGCDYTGKFGTKHAAL